MAGVHKCYGPVAWGDRGLKSRTLALSDKNQNVMRYAPAI